MPRPLTLVAITGLTVSAVAFVAAGTLAANSFTTFFPWNNFFDWAENRERCTNEMGNAGEADATREFAWDGGNEINLSVTGTVRYRPGPANRAFARGPAYLVGELNLGGDSIRYDCSPRDAPRVEIEIEAEGIDAFSVLGRGDLVLTDLNEPNVEIMIAGSGSVVATGTVERLELTIAGSGDADLGGVMAREVEVAIAGSGDAIVAPSERIDVSIAGSGDVELLTDPPDVRTEIFGSGRVTRR